MTRDEAWEACKAELPAINWSISDEATYRAFFFYGYVAGGKRWREAVRLMGEELKKYRPKE